MNIADQRDLYGPTNVADMWTWWRDMLARNNLEPVDDHRTVTAYVSLNRWCADCPYCGGGLACWDENPHGCCLGCGHVYKVRWPHDHKVAAQVLEERDPVNRHWHPHHGETIAALIQENDDHRAATAVLSSVPSEPAAYEFEVAAAYDHAKPGGGGPADELLAKLTTGYSIAWDEKSGIAVVRLHGHPDHVAAQVKRAMTGK